MIGMWAFLKNQFSKNKYTPLYYSIELIDGWKLTVPEELYDSIYASSEKNEDDLITISVEKYNRYTNQTMFIRIFHDSVMVDSFFDGYDFLRVNATTKEMTIFDE